MQMCDHFVLRFVSRSHTHTHTHNEHIQICQFLIHTHCKKENALGQHYTNAEALSNATRFWLQRIKHFFYWAGIHSLAQRWK
jgi:hypothetical protein